jgi:hypothetical protein
VILYRTTRYDADTAAALDALAVASGRAVAVVIDERGGAIDTDGHAKVSVTVPAVRALGLYAPPDFAWRCGDYGFYLARAQFPEVRDFWLIEDDVRIVAPAAFFALTDAHPAIDMLAGELRAAEDGWWWEATARSRDARVMRAFFPVVRMSARAIDVARDKRVAHGRLPWRRAQWPNDEAFAATAIAHAGLSWRDLNALGKPLYDPATFSFRGLIDGGAVPVAPDDRAQLLHPVLSGERYRRKIASVAGEAAPKSRWEKFTRRWAPRVAKRLRW